MLKNVIEKFFKYLLFIQNVLLPHSTGFAATCDGFYEASHEDSYIVDLTCAYDTYSGKLPEDGYEREDKGVPSLIKVAKVNLIYNNREYHVEFIIILKYIILKIFIQKKIYHLKKEEIILKNGQIKYMKKKKID